LFIIMLLPLVFHGGGRISLDRALLILTSRGDRASDTLGDLGSAALALLVLALSVVFMEPAWGITLLAAAALALVMLLIRNRR
jgi:putative oxidoreductase